MSVPAKPPHQPTDGPPPRTNFNPVVVAVAINALLAAGATAYLLLGHRPPINPDAKLTACTYDGHSNSSTAHVTVTNTGTDTARYELTLEFDAYQGYNPVRRDVQGLAIINVEPGQIVEDEIPDYSSADLVCSLQSAYRRPVRD
jgi:hypothetical protein